MRPTLTEGCAILVDYDRKELRSNSIYVFRANGELLVKRAVLWSSGDWWWHSTIPSWKPRRWNESMKIWAEVCWVGTTIHNGLSAYA